MKYLICSPDRYGRFGHQSFSIMGPWLIAATFDCRLIKPQYMYFCNKWNQYTNWSKSRYVADKIPVKIDEIKSITSQLSKDNINNKFNLVKVAGIKQIRSQIFDTTLNSIISLPFDQTGGSLTKLLNHREIRNDLSAYSFPGEQELEKKRYVCIHIRRGDVSQTQNRHKYISNDFYYCLIDLISSLLKHQNEDSDMYAGRY